MKSLEDKEHALEEAKKRAERYAADVKVQNHEFWKEEHEKR